MPRTADDWIREYKAKNALWIHDGNSKRPHALLTSGLHSNGFFNSKLVIPDEELLDEAACDLVELFIRPGGDIAKIQGVVGPQTGATKLAELMSTEIWRITGDPCFFASPAKSDGGGYEDKRMIFSKKELCLLFNKSVLLCEDVLTTGGSVDLTATAITNAHGTTLPFIFVLVNRSGLTETDGKKIVALIDHAMPMWTPEECPLCKQGSKAVRPKDNGNWALLNAGY